MQVHTREAIKRKALIPICNCFSISTVLLTGPKSGNALSPVSNLSKSELRVYACVLLFFFPPPPPPPLVRIRRSTRVPRAASREPRVSKIDDNRKRQKRQLRSSSLIVNKFNTAARSSQDLTRVRERAVFTTSSVGRVAFRMC